MSTIKKEKTETSNLETRKTVYDGVETEYKFLVIRSAKDWLPATDFKARTELQYPGLNKRLTITANGISFFQYDSAEAKYRLPPKPDNFDSLSPSEKEAKELVRNKIIWKKRFELFEISTGKSIPGNTPDEKIAYMNKLGAGEAEAFFDRLLTYHSAIEEGTLLQRYISQLSESIEQIEMDSFDDWMKLSQVGSVFRMQRPFEDHIIEIQLKQLTEEARIEIEENTKDPIPPSKPGIHPVTKKVDAAFTAFNYEDQKYIEQKRAIEHKRIKMYFQAVLPFEIPGDTEGNKWKWISDRLIGDVIKLRNFIEGQVSDYRSKIPFFSSVSGLVS